MRRLWVAVLGLVVAGCGQTVEGTPAVDASSFELFDPCEIPADAVRATGANPDDVVARDYFGVEAKDWDLCTWDAGWYYLTVLSTTHTMREIEENPQSVNFRQTTVGAREAVTYVERNDPDLQRCDIAFPWSLGSIVVRASTKGGLPKEEDPCQVASRSAEVLDPALRK